MNPDLDIVRKINGLAGRVRPFDLMMDLIARYGHWAFVIYGLFLWFTPGKDREVRRRCCIHSFLGRLRGVSDFLCPWQNMVQKTAVYPGLPDMELYRP